MHIISIVWMKKLRLRMAKQLTSGKSLSQDLNLGLPDAKTITET